MGPVAPPVCELLLVGGGHSHVQVLKAFGMASLAGVRLTVLAREVNSPYSGMLPGYVAGRGEWEDLHIDLGRLCRFAGARLIDDEAVALDLEGNRVHCRRRPPLRFDLLSINCGAVPEAQAEAGVPVKPIGRFLPAWEAVRKNVRAGERVVFVGGGAGGVELALAARRALRDEVQVQLVAAEFLPGHGAVAKRLLRRKLAQAGIGLTLGAVAVADVQDGDGAGTGLLHLENGDRLPFDHLFWVTGVIAPDWIRNSALATDAKGFIRVDAGLRSVSHPQVCAAGDVIRFADRALPKSGVYAVRAGPVLADNLRRALLGRRPRTFKPQRLFLSLVGTGDGSAVASWGPLAVQGRWAWRWKNRIDRRFMANYQQLPLMQTPPLTPSLVCTLTSAPAFSSSRIASTWPWYAAKCRGLYPSLARTLTCSPSFNKVRILAMSPSIAASCNGHPATTARSLFSTAEVVLVSRFILLFVGRCVLELCKDSV